MILDDSNSGLGKDKLGNLSQWSVFHIKRKDIENLSNFEIFRHCGSEEMLKKKQDLGS